LRAARIAELLSERPGVLQRRVLPAWSGVRAEWVSHVSNREFAVRHIPESDLLSERPVCGVDLLHRNCLSRRHVLSDRDELLRQRHGPDDLLPAGTVLHQQPVHAVQGSRVRIAWVANLLLDA
jgi:hypothetical protein